MITKEPVTAKGYLYYHRLMWGRIIKEMEKGEILDNNLKRKIWKGLFSFKSNTNCCFPCAWKDDCQFGWCHNCLLEFKGEPCLDGFYDIATGITDQRIEAAKKIRDLPMKEIWK